jgi:hypothetical protein
MERKMRRWKSLAAPILAAVLLMAFAACSPISGQASIKIREPAEAFAGDVTISVDVTDFDLGGPDGNGGQGRIVYYLDAAVPTYYEHSAISKAGTYAISSETSHTWKGVTPGEHRFSAQLVDGNDSPLPSPVVDTVVVTVGAPEGLPQITQVDPSDGSSLPPGNILVSLGVENFIVSRADMGVVNRIGEGHLIFYMDEDPPTDQGAPATTDTSIVSTDLSRLWKGVTEGKHTFSVQLVNNDDTPLETPVVATVIIDVKAAG